MTKLGKFAAAYAAVLCAFGAFADLTPKAWNGGASGDWGVAENWDPQGVPTADDAVTIGSGTVTISDTAATAGSLTVASGAKLFFGCEGTDVTKMTPLEVAANDFSLTIVGDFAVNGQCAVGGLNSAGKPSVSVGGNLALGANGKLAVYAGEVEIDADNPEKYVGDGAMVTVVGNLTTASGAWIYPQCHNTVGASVRWTVGGDVEIGAGGGFDAMGRGWIYGHGLGFANPNDDGCGGTYGGRGGSSSSTRIYGLATAPFLPGSPGKLGWSSAGNSGGGVIRIHADGKIALEGMLDASAEDKSANHGPGSGGSVFLTCTEFVPSTGAKIKADGGNSNYGTQGGGGGGRVAIVIGGLTAEQLGELYATGEFKEMWMLSEDLNDPNRYDYPDLVDISGGAAKNAAKNGSSGTGVCLCNVSSRRVLSVSVAPSAVDIMRADLNLPIGNSLTSGEITATAAEYSFVPGTDSRERRHCLGFVFSNDVGTVVSDSALNYTFDASAAAAKSCLEWDYTDLEKRLVVAIDGEGSVDGGENWSDDGTVLTLTPVPAEGWRFLCWSGEVPSANLNDNPLALMMNVPRDITARFIPDVKLTGEVAAVQDGEWFDAATWGGAGVPGPEASVMIDGFAVRNTQASIPEAGSITLNGTGSLTLGELNCPYKPQLDVGGDLAISDKAVLTVYSCGLDAAEDSEAYVGDGALVFVGTNLTLSGSAVVNVYCHNTCGTSPRFTIGGDVTVGAGAKFDAMGRGWIYGYGIGFANPSDDGCGGTYGGRGGSTSSPQIYGLATAPFLPGSPGKQGWSSAGNSGGGVIRIHADGKITLEGTLDASAEDKSANHGPGSGGSVFLTCTEFVPSTGAKIKADGGNSDYGSQGGGGGGRVAIVIGGLTAEQLDDLYETGEFAGMRVIADDMNDSNQYDYTEVVDVSGGTAKNSAKNGAKGTSRLLANPGQKRSLVVTLYPSAQDVTLPVCDPLPGMQMLEGVVSATAAGTSFVPGTNSRQRRNCTGYVYSNDVGTVVSDDALSAEFNLAEAAETAWLEWRYDDLEYLLRVTSVLGDGEIQNVGDWHDAGSSVTITAVPADGWKFACWNGELPVADKHVNPLTIRMSQPRDISAMFVPVESPSGEVNAVKNGDWFDPSVWDVGSVPGEGSDVKIDGKTVTAVNPYDLKVGSLVLSGAAKLTLGVKDEEYGVNLVVGGDLVLTNTAQFTVYAGQLVTNDLVRYAKGSSKISVGGDVIVNSGCWVKPVSSPTTGASVWFEARNFDVRAGGGFDAEGSGFANLQGPGCPHQWFKITTGNEGYGGSYGGVQGIYGTDNKRTPTYGFAYAPYFPGSPGVGAWAGYNSNVKGGGAILLRARRGIKVAGTLNAKGPSYNTCDKASSGNGSGGGIWLIAKHFALEGGAVITAAAGVQNYGGCAPSGGGRICLLTGNPDDALFASLATSGASKRVEVLCDDVTDAEKCDFSDVFSVSGGTNVHNLWRGTERPQATAGTAVWLKVRTAGLSVIIR